MARAGSMSLKVQGMEKVSSKLRVMARTFPEAAAKGLNEAAEITMAWAKIRTPVKTGRLKSTGRVAKMPTKDSLEAQLAFGTDYAVYVHEIPPPPQKSEGGRSATHKVGQWKYLESAVNEAVSNGTIRRSVMDAIRKWLKT